MVPRERRNEREPGRRGVTIGRRVSKIGFMGRGLGAPRQGKSGIVHALRLRIDGDRITEGAGERERCRHDAMPRRDLFRKMFSRKPIAVVFPDSGRCVADVLDVCIEEKTPAVPRGLGSVGLGGAVPLRGGVVIDLSRMNKVISIDRERDKVTVEPGCTWERLREEAASEGLSLRSYPPDSVGGTVGGWISTGGYGVGTLADGRFHTRLESLEVAVPSGLLVSAGHGRGRYSIESFTGTEGQLGVITASTFSLKKKPESRAHYVLGPGPVENVVGALRDLARMDDPPLGLRLLSGKFPALMRDVGSSSECDPMLALLFEGKESNIIAFGDHLKGLARRTAMDLRCDDGAPKVFETRFTDVARRPAKTVVRSGEALVGIDRLAGFIEVLKEDSGGRILVDTQVVGRGLALVMTCYLIDRRGLPPVVRDVPLTVRTSLAAIRYGGRPYGMGIWNSPFSKNMLGKERKHLEAIKNDTDRLRILNPGKFFSLTTGSGLPVWGLTYRIGLRLIESSHEGGVK